MKLPISNALENCYKEHLYYFISKILALIIVRLSGEKNENRIHCHSNKSVDVG